MRGPFTAVADPFRLTRGRLFEQYPLVGALLVEIRKSERLERAPRLYLA